MDKKQGKWQYYNADSMLSLEDRVRISVAAFEKRFGEKASVCYVHPRMINHLPAERQPKVVDDVEVYSDPIVQNNQFYIG